MVQSVSACGASLYGLHGSGVKGSLPRWLLLLPALCRGLGQLLFLCDGFVVDAKQQTVVHDLKALQNLAGHTSVHSKKHN